MVATDRWGRVAHCSTYSAALSAQKVAHHAIHCSERCADRARERRLRTARFASIGTRTCRNCSAPFQPSYDAQARKFCSDACLKAPEQNRRRRLGERPPRPPFPVLRTCLCCPDTFDLRLVPHQRYCSKRCSERAKRARQRARATPYPLAVLIALRGQLMRLVKQAPPRRTRLATCRVCNAPFTRSQIAHRARYCSPDCQRHVARQRDRTRTHHRFVAKGERFCLHCRAPFRPRLDGQSRMFCSLECRKAAAPRCSRARPPRARACAACGVLFQGKWRKKYCSPTCSRAMRNARQRITTPVPAERLCLQCVAAFPTHSQRGKRYCSKRCRDAASQLRATPSQLRDVIALQRELTYLLRDPERTTPHAQSA